ncbi:hypothetical protein BVRB_5g112480 [Beta vulgaris subsp. vulgaris]|nr:hypothetical protein BVRB_5g112480 [Beta vulgaris subsp. vulgaris]
MSDSGKQIQTKASAKGKGRWRSINQIYADTGESLGTMYSRLKRQDLLEAKHHCYTLPPPGMNMGLYYNFCHQYGHKTDRCVDLRQAIHQLIEDGKIPIPPSWVPPFVSFTKADLSKELDPHQALASL